MLQTLTQQSAGIVKFNDFKNGNLYHPQHDFAYLTERFLPFEDLLDDDGNLVLYEFNLNTFHQDFPPPEPPTQVEHAYVAVTRAATSRSYTDAVTTPPPNAESQHDTLLTLDGHAPSNMNPEPTSLDPDEELATTQHMVQALLARGVPKAQILYTGDYSPQQRGEREDDDSDSSLQDENENHNRKQQQQQGSNNDEDMRIRPHEDDTSDAAQGSDIHNLRGNHDGNGSNGGDDDGDDDDDSDNGSDNSNDDSDDDSDRGDGGGDDGDGGSDGDDDGAASSLNANSSVGEEMILVARDEPPSAASLTKLLTKQAKYQELTKLQMLPNLQQ
jgi:hypothetical protein